MGSTCPLAESKMKIIPSAQSVPFKGLQLYSSPTVTLWKHKGLSEILDVESCWQSILWFNLEDAQTTPVLQMFVRFLKLSLKYLLCNRVECCNLALHSLSGCVWGRVTGTDTCEASIKQVLFKFISLFGFFFFYPKPSLTPQSSSEHHLFSSIWNHVALKFWTFNCCAT